MQKKNHARDGKVYKHTLRTTKAWLGYAEMESETQKLSSN